MNQLMQIITACSMLIIQACTAHINSHSYDLTSEFAHITKDGILRVVHLCWSVATLNVDKHTIGHETCNARLLAKC
jgi:hypothetical protein